MSNKIDPERSRQGVKGHYVRYVLAASLVAVVAGFVIVVAVF